MSGREKQHAGYNLFSEVFVRKFGLDYRSLQKLVDTAWCEMSEFEKHYWLTRASAR